MAEFRAYYTGWRTDTFECVCGWRGSGADLKPGAYGGVFIALCPGCEDRAILILNRPTTADMETGAIAGNADAARELLRFHTYLEAEGFKPRDHGPWTRDVAQWGAGDTLFQLDQVGSAMEGPFYLLWMGESVSADDDASAIAAVEAAYGRYEIERVEDEDPDPQTTLTSANEVSKFVGYLETEGFTRRDNGTWTRDLAEWIVGSDHLGLESVVSVHAGLYYLLWLSRAILASDDEAAIAEVEAGFLGKAIEATISGASQGSDNSAKRSSTAAPDHSMSIRLEYAPTYSTAAEWSKDGVLLIESSDTTDSMDLGRGMTIPEPTRLLEWLCHDRFPGPRGSDWLLGYCQIHRVAMQSDPTGPEPQSGYPSKLELSIASDVVHLYGSPSPDGWQGSPRPERSSYRLDGWRWLLLCLLQDRCAGLRAFTRVEHLLVDADIVPTNRWVG